MTISIIHNNHGENEKVYYNEMVYRPQNHHYHEIPQTGIECIGTIDSLEESEVVHLAAQSLSLLSDSWVLRICDAGLLQAVLEELHISPGFQKQVLSAITQKSVDEVHRMAAQGNISERADAALSSLIDLYAPLKKGIEEAGKLLEGEKCCAILAHLARLAEILDDETGRILLDFSVVSNMDYYNGVIFQGAVKEIPFPLLSGGRYDRLPEKMNKKVSAIGFAVYMDYVENYGQQETVLDADTVIRYAEEDDYALLARTAEILRSRGVRVRLMRNDDDSRVHSAGEMSFEEARREAGI